MVDKPRAAVLGGGIAGLLAARVLADHCANVTVFDRDDLSLPSAERRGVPQGRHAHVLLSRGQQILEELFPGLTDELITHGAPHGDALGDTRLYFSGHRLRQATAGLPMLSISRPFLEGHVRARVAALPRVAFAPPCDIVGLAATSDARRVTGVRVFRRADDSPAEVIGADLVVDATGRGSRTPRWLKQLGYEPPTEERVEIEVGYATGVYRLAPDALDGNLACLQTPTPELARGGALALLENDQWMLTLTGVLGDHPPTDPDRFAEFARSLRFPDIHDAINDKAPIGDPVAYRFPANVRRRYERLARFPGGLLVIGDGICSFNPIYGQGMTVAALEALALGTHLRRHPRGRPPLFHRELARIVDPPWDMAIGGDLTFPAVNGPRTRKLRVASAYIARLHAAAAHDAALATAFLRVSSLVDRPEALMHPGVATRVLRHMLRRSPGKPGRPPVPMRHRQHMYSENTACGQAAAPSKGSPMTTSMFDETIAKFRTDPAAAQTTPAVTATLTGDRARLSSGPFTWEADLPPIIGGSNRAPSPTAYLLGALAGCAVAFIRDTLAPQLGIQLTDVSAVARCRADLRGLFDPDNANPRLEDIAIEITIDSPDTPGRVEKLRQAWLARCPIYLALINPTNVTVTWPKHASGAP